MSRGTKTTITVIVSLMLAYFALIAGAVGLDPLRYTVPRDTEINEKTEYYLKLQGNSYYKDYHVEEVGKNEYINVHLVMNPSRRLGSVDYTKPVFMFSINSQKDNGYYLSIKCSDAPKTVDSVEIRGSFYTNRYDKFIVPAHLMQDPSNKCDTFTISVYDYTKQIIKDDYYISSFNIKNVTYDDIKQHLVVSDVQVGSLIGGILMAIVLFVIMPIALILVNKGHDKNNKIMDGLGLRNYKEQLRKGVITIDEYIDKLRGDKNDKTF